MNEKLSRAQRELLAWIALHPISVYSREGSSRTGQSLLKREPVYEHGSIPRLMSATDKGRAALEREA